MILVMLKHERNKPFQGKRMSDPIAARGGIRPTSSSTCSRKAGACRPCSSSFRARHAADHEAAVDVDRLGRERGEWTARPAAPCTRYYGTFLRVLGRYVRELKVITLPEAVKKMTSMNADKLASPIEGG